MNGIKSGIKESSTIETRNLCEAEKDGSEFMGNP
jgi:hypothetical protein